MKANIKGKQVVKITSDTLTSGSPPHTWRLECDAVRVFQDRVVLYFIDSAGDKKKWEYPIVNILEMRVNGKKRVFNGFRIPY